MKILKVNKLRGPNIWANYPVLEAWVDLEELKDTSSEMIPGFNERLMAWLPTMVEHRCSVGERGGFFVRLRRGTYMAHILEHVTLELQSLAGTPVGFGRARETAVDGIYKVAIAYKEEQLGLVCIDKAFELIMAAIHDTPYDIEKVVTELKEYAYDVCLGPSTRSIVDAAKARGIPWRRLNEGSLVQLGYGVHQRRICTAESDSTSAIAESIAQDKDLTRMLLRSIGVPTPEGRPVESAEDAWDAAEDIGMPVVVKPQYGNHGRGVATNLQSKEQVMAAYQAAREEGRSIVVERHAPGDDYRMLVVGGKLIAAARREPAHVIGDGQSTVQQLIDKVNEDPRRSDGHSTSLSMIKIDAVALGVLLEQGMTPDTIPPLGKKVLIRRNANLSTGGTATDVTDMVHPDMARHAVEAARVIGLDIAGVDIVAQDISQPLQGQRGVIVEVNAGPGLRMHIEPSAGSPRPVGQSIIDMMFPGESNGRIPIVSVTGVNGKTTTTRLIAHIVRAMGYQTGFTTTDGIYINNRLVETGDCTGPVSAEFVLKDPTVNFAVLETARGGILRAGLGYTKCDVAVVTNISADHLGLKGIHTLDDLARVKSVVPESVVQGGYAILNAEDEMVYNMRRKLNCNIALFSMDPENAHVQALLRKGGMACVAEDGYITINKGGWKIRVAKISDIPLTMGGRARFMISNILAAVLAVYVREPKLEEIRLALETFIPSPTQTPGRMNEFRFRHFTVLVDYAHNSAGYQALSDYLAATPASYKTGIIAGVGDRRDEDIRELGVIAAGMFDRIIIRQDRNNRGRSSEEIIGLLMEGIRSKSNDIPCEIIPRESEAIDHAARTARKGELLTICSDVVPDALEQIKQLKEQDDREALAAAQA
jgi:cyanophycin synthetase